MHYLFDSQDDLPALNPVELHGPAALDGFRALLARYLAGPELTLSLEPKS
jgi:hypothetical protein